ncbi:MAG: acyl-CoA dehydrogenase family protein, partial [Cyanobacteria bacterium J06650_10]
MAPTIDSSRIIEGWPQKQLETHLRFAVQPIASRLDGETALLFKAFNDLGERGWLAPKTPQHFGGLGISAQAYQQLQGLIATYSGALAFLQTQHQSAASLLLSGENQELKQTYLADMVTGRRKVGVGFSQLRRHPAPLKAQKVTAGYRISGVVPWVTGAGLFTEFVGAAVLPDGRAVFGLLPLESQGGHGRGLSLGEPMALAGMAATSTVQVRVNDWLLNNERVIAVKPADWLEGRDRANPLSPIGLIFGCTQAAINELQANLARRKIDHPASQQLPLKLAWLRMDAPRVMALPEEAYEQKMALRGRAIAL